MVADAIGRIVRVATALARLAKVANVERIAVIAIAAALAVCTLIARRAGRAHILLRGHAILVIIYGGHLARGTEVVRGQIQRTLAGSAIIGPTQPRVAIKPSCAALTVPANGVMLTGATL